LRTALRADPSLSEDPDFQRWYRRLSELEGKEQRDLEIRQQVEKELQHGARIAADVAAVGQDLALQFLVQPAAGMALQAALPGHAQPGISQRHRSQEPRRPFCGLTGGALEVAELVSQHPDRTDAVVFAGPAMPMGPGQTDLEGRALMVLTALSAVAVTVTGGLAEEVGNLLGLGDTAVTVWGIAKWPVLLLLVSFMFAVLYWAAPNVKQPGFRWISPGGVLAVVGWVIASAAFAFYVANFGSYNKTYGALAGPIIFLVWLWISNIMILLGAEFNAEIERGRRIEAGMRPEEKEPFAEPRDTRKMEKNPS
jgi:hypothetical protein